MSDVSDGSDAFVDQYRAHADESVQQLMVCPALTPPTSRGFHGTNFWLHAGAGPAAQRSREAV
jgi:hypothetical protein